MERSIRISKFRNIGLIKPEQLVLNYSLEKGKLGGLITIIGPNNAGKSNFLDALEVFGNGKFSSRDVSNLSFEPKDQIPELVLMAKDADEFYKYGFDYNGKTYSHYPIKGEEKGRKRRKKTTGHPPRWRPAMTSAAESAAKGTAPGSGNLTRPTAFPATGAER